MEEIEYLAIKWMGLNPPTLPAEMGLQPLVRPRPILVVCCYLALQPFKFKVTHKSRTQMVIADLLQLATGQTVPPGLRLPVGCVTAEVWFNGVL